MNHDIDTNTETDTIEKSRHCLLWDGVGIYIPQRFVRNFDAPSWHIKPADIAILEAGPDHPHYDETWDYVLRYAFYVDASGTRYRLEQDGDLFAVKEKTA